MKAITTPSASLLLLVAMTHSISCERAPSTSSLDSGLPFVFIDRVSDARTSLDAPSHAFSEQVTFGQETRTALSPPLRSTMTFELELPANPELRFAVAAAPEDTDVMPAAVDFIVRVAPASHPENLTAAHEARVRRREPETWLPQVVDLSAWGDSRVALSFVTRVDPARDPGTPLPMRPYWANPVLSERDAPAPRPNLILISLDCVRADHLGAYGYERDTTPSLDAFARDGVVFETAMSSASFTHATHMSMLTGLPPSLNAVSRWSKPGASVAFLPEILAARGYRTSGIVSGPLLSQHFGFERGFHYYRTYHDTTRGEHLVEAALDLLEGGTGQSQFLFLHFFDAHWPYWPTDEFKNRYGPRPENVSELLRKVREQIPPDRQRDIDDLRNLYDAELAYMDTQVGRFLEGLETLGLYDDALIIVTADHGEAFFEHDFWEHGQTLYDEMVHVPLIIKWPGESPTGRVGALVSQIDIFPTLLEAAGLEPAGEGEPLLSYAARQPASSARTVVMEITWDPLETRDARMLVGMRTEGRKYLASLEAPTVDALYDSEIVGEQLFDLRADPGERHDIASASPEEIAAWRERVTSYLARARQIRSVRSGEEVTLDDEVLERLRALGYVNP